MNHPSFPVDSRDSHTRGVDRFEAVRRHVFLEMQGHARRWVWLFVVPLYLAMAALFLVTCGSQLRAIVQIVALVVCHGPLLMGHYRSRVSVRPFVWAGLHYLIVMAVTGGITSPVLPMGLPFIAAAGLLVGDRRSKMMLAAALACGFGAMAAVAASPFGALPSPLASSVGAPTPAYFVTLAFSSAVAVISLARTGIFVTDAYASVALELAARREEICEEGADYSRALEGMAARLAHEVKNPLAAIKALSTHVARQSQDAKTAERLGIVASEADRLQAIVDGFLSFSRGLGDLRVVPTRPYELARELSVLLETRLSEQGVAMEVIGDEKLELLADGRKLRQALLNLVLNAMHASPSGSTITVAVVLTKDDRVRIRVVDRGAGMTAEVLERIRKPYFSTREGGSGLGIAVARAMVEQHGGELRFESRPGHGTTATIDLPQTVVAGSKQEVLPQLHASTPGVLEPRKLIG